MRPSVLYICLEQASLFHPPLLCSLITFSEIFYSCSSIFDSFRLFDSGKWTIETSFSRYGDATQKSTYLPTLGFRVKNSPQNRNFMEIQISYALKGKPSRSLHFQRNFTSSIEEIFHVFGCLGKILLSTSSTYAGKFGNF